MKKYIYACGALLSFFACGKSATASMVDAMKACNVDASEKHLSGEARKEFMRNCLRESSPQPRQSAEQHSRAVVHRDEFTGKVSLNYPTNTHSHRFSLLFSAQLKPTKSAATMLFHGSGDEWRYLKCHSVDALVDQKPMRLPESDHDGDVFSGGVSESVTVAVPTQALRAFAKAKELKFRVCSDVYEMSAEDIAGLEEFASKYVRGQ